MSEPARCSVCGTPLANAEVGCPHCLLAEALDGSQKTAAGPGFLDDLPVPTPTNRGIGDYELLEVIARGGMGIVYKARQRSLGRIVALKLLLGGVHASEGFHRRFRQEAQMAAKLQHPHIVPIYDVGEHEGEPFFSMEYVPGTDLGRMVQGQSLSPARAATYVEAIADAIQYAHEKGILHRDLKPSNILVGSDDRPRITDFGLARETSAETLTLSGETLGTPGYLPPEQASTSRGTVGPHSDVYALGALLYHLLTGRPPFVASSLADALEQVLNTDPMAPRRLNPGIPRDLETICLKCLAKTPSQRYLTASELRDELRRWADGKPLLARPASVAEKTFKWIRRRPALSASLGLVALSTLLGLTGILWQWNQAVTARGKAEEASAMSSNTVVRLRMQLAEDAWTAGKPWEQLGYLAGILRQQPTNQLAITRLLSILGQRNFLLPACRPLMHLRQVLDFQFSQDGSRIATGADDRRGMIFDARDGHILAGPLNHQGSVTQVRFSPDATRLLTCSQTNVAHLWNVTPNVAGTGKLLAELDGHAAEVVSAEFDASGIRALTASYDGTIQVWDMSKGPRALIRLRYNSPVLQAVFSPDGQRILARFWNQNALIWNIRDGQTGTVQLAHSAPVTFCGFSPDGKTVATCSSNSIHLWDAASGRVLGPPLDHPSPVNRFSFSPDGERLAGATGKESLSFPSAAWIWASSNGVWSVLAGPLSHENEVTVTEFSPDGLLLLSASLDQTAKVWDAQTGQLLAMPLVHKGGVVCASFNPNGDRMATASRDYQVSLWDVRLGRPENLYYKHDSGVVAVDFRKDGRTALTATRSGFVYSWDLLSGVRQEPGMAHPGAVVFAKFLPDGRRILTGATDGRLRVWRADDGKLWAESPPVEGLIRNVHCDEVGHQIVASTYSTNVVIWEPEGHPMELGYLAHPCGLFSARLSRDGKRIVTAGSDGMARVWDTSSRRLLTDRLFSREYALTISRDMVLNFYRASKQEGTTLAQTKPAAVVASPGVSFPTWFYEFPESRIWEGMALTNVAMSNADMRGYLQHVAGHATSVETLWADFSPDGKWIATASMDGTGRLWDSETGKGYASAFAHLGPVAYVEFSPDGSKVATASADHTARIWNSATQHPITAPLAHKEPVMIVHFSPDGRKLGSATLGGTLHIWDVSTGLPLTDPFNPGCRIQDFTFSLDSQRVIIGGEDGYARMWDIVSPTNAASSTLLSLAEALGGVKNLVDNAEPLTLDHLFNVVQQRRRPGGTDYYSRYCRWALASGPAMAIPMGCSITPEMYLERLLANNDRESLEQAVRLCPTDARAFSQLAAQLANQDPKVNPRSSPEAFILRHRAQAFAPK